MMKFKQQYTYRRKTLPIILLLLFSLLTFSCTVNLDYHKFAGSYYYVKVSKEKSEVQNSNNPLFSNLLYLYPNHTFLYIGLYHAGTVNLIYEGVWEDKRKYLLFNKSVADKDTSQYEGMKLTKVERFYNDSLEKIGARLLYFYDISQDTTYLTGAFLSTTETKHIVGVKEPILIGRQYNTINFSDLGYEMHYAFDANEQNNVFKFYLTYHFKEYCTRLDSIPFEKLKYKGKQLYLGKEGYFEQKKE